MRRTGTLYIVAVRHRILGNVINMVHAFRQSPHHEGEAFVTLQKVGISEALLGIIGERLRSLGDIKSVIFSLPHHPVRKVRHGLIPLSRVLQ